MNIKYNISITYVLLFIQFINGFDETDPRADKELLMTINMEHCLRVGHSPVPNNELYPEYYHATYLFFDPRTSAAERLKIFILGDSESKTKVNIQLLNLKKIANNIGSSLELSIQQDPKDPAASIDYTIGSGKDGGKMYGTASLNNLAVPYFLSIYLHKNEKYTSATVEKTKAYIFDQNGYIKWKKGKDLKEFKGVEMNSNFFRLKVKIGSEKKNDKLAPVPVILSCPGRCRHKALKVTKDGGEEDLVYEVSYGGQRKLNYALMVSAEIEGLSFKFSCDDRTHEIEIVFFRDRVDVYTIENGKPNKIADQDIGYPPYYFLRRVPDFRKNIEALKKNSNDYHRLARYLGFHFTIDLDKRIEIRLVTGSKSKMIEMESITPSATIDFTKPIFPGKGIDEIYLNSFSQTAQPSPHIASWIRDNADVDQRYAVYAQLERYNYPCNVFASDFDEFADALKIEEKFNSKIFGELKPEEYQIKIDEKMALLDIIEDNSSWPEGLQQEIEESTQNTKSGDEEATNI
ncbi:hypothetical protein QYM36_012193 [Artemia franciscana]|uniref:Uncharacterized protein n=1 Tax=Artemia franciscana TaxID=6661 RepID=A0AA88HTT5_ARTSF|nr:hypothetical protein QYM36_012193 [Artemia franciscana]